MPCFRCGARQSDPARGPSPWKRGVRDGRQVLLCPDCQRDREWVADLDPCPRCASTQLTRHLGETRCRSCGWAGGDPGGSDTAVRPDPELSAEVAAAVERVLRGTPAHRPDA